MSPNDQPADRETVKSQTERIVADLELWLESLHCSNKAIVVQIEETKRELYAAQDLLRSLDETEN